MSRLYRHGLAVGSSFVTNPNPPKRGTCSGWNPAVARRNMRFLWSVDTAAIDHLKGYAFTWTVKSCPATPVEFAKALKKALEELKRGSRFGPPAELIHWVIEWQRRGVPHVHGVVYFTPKNDCWSRDHNGVSWGMINHIKGVWLKWSQPWESFALGQHVHFVYDSVGWSEYVAKHASRGAKHYQRSSKSLPTSWQGDTGRMWGKRGDWPVDPPTKVFFLRREPDANDIALAKSLNADPVSLRTLYDPRGYAAFRRLVRSYEVSRSRFELQAARSRLLPEQTPLRSASVLSETERAQSGSAVGQPNRAVCRYNSARRSLVFSRRMLKCHDVEISASRGLSRWIPEKVSQLFIQNLRKRGFVIHLIREA